MLPAIVMARALEAVEARQSHVETEMFQSRLLSGCRRTLGLGSLCCTGQQGAGSMDGIQPVANQLCVCQISPHMVTESVKQCAISDHLSHHAPAVRVSFHMHPYAVLAYVYDASRI